MTSSHRSIRPVRTFTAALAMASVMSLAAIGQQGSVQTQSGDGDTASVAQGDLELVAARSCGKYRGLRNGDAFRNVIRMDGFKMVVWNRVTNTTQGVCVNVFDADGNNAGDKYTAYVNLGPGRSVQLGPVTGRPLNRYVDVTGRGGLNAVDYVTFRIDPRGKAGPFATSMQR